MTKISSGKKQLPTQQTEALLKTLKTRFEKNMNRHKGVEWNEVEGRFKSHPEKLLSLQAMEESGGEPDVVGKKTKTGEYFFYDCAPETPAGRRSFCYDREGQESRKSFAPENNAVDHASAMGVVLLTEEEYRELQTLGSFDTKTSSWIHTPDAVRKLGGALFMDRRYNQVFVYHNSAPSYYASRGYRGVLKV